MTKEEIAAQTAADEAAAAEAPAAEAQMTQARVLMDCALGRANDVVSLIALDLKTAEAAGMADSDKAAVKYALSLKTD